MAKDKDPVLDERFFGLLYPMIHVDVSDEIRNHAYEQDMVKHRLYGAGKLLEAAISAKKGLKRHDTMGMDFVDGSDAKTSSVRWSSRGKVYSAPITDTFNKRSLLRCVVFERINNKFYYFLIPRAAYAHISKTSNIEISFKLDGTPNRGPGNNTIIDWWEFEVENFDGILSDTILPFTNYKELRLRKKELAQSLSAIRKEQSLLKGVAPKRYSRKKTKNHSSLQTSILCTEDLDQP